MINLQNHSLSQFFDLLFLKPLKIVAKIATVAENDKNMLRWFIGRSKRSLEQTDKLSK